MGLFTIVFIVVIIGILFDALIPAIEIDNKKQVCKNTQITIVLNTDKTTEQELDKLFNLLLSKTDNAEDIVNALLRQLVEHGVCTSEQAIEFKRNIRT